MPLLRVISAAEVKAALPMARAIEMMKEAFTRLSAGEAVLPLRTHIPVPDHGGSVLFMPSYLPASDRFGVKVLSLFFGNPAKGMPRIQALMILSDGRTGTPLAAMDGASLTAIRTGAASGAATELLSRADASTVAVFGAGAQGRTQLEAVACVRKIRRAWIYDPDREAADRFAREMADRLGLEVEAAATPAHAVRGADIVCTATVSRTPVFADSDLKPGAHINAVGSYQPGVREIPGETVARALIVVDHRESAFAEAGDLLIPLEEGLIGEERMKTELGEVIAGKAAGRTTEREITLFKAVGVGIQDLLAAAVVLQRAEELGLGKLADL